MKLPEGWPTEAMKQTGSMEMWRRFDLTDTQCDAGEIFKAMLAAAPTPPAPAQEDEPVAWMHDQDGRVECIHDSVKQLWIKVGQPDNGVRFYREMVKCKVEHYTVPLYLRPTSNKLRQAADDALCVLDLWKKHGKFPLGVLHAEVNIIERLRAALEAKNPPAPAKEDEIAGYQVWHPDIQRWTNCGKFTAEDLSKKPGFKIRPVYTRPADDKLRKAAQELLNAYDDECVTGKIGASFENLRAVLEGKS